MTQNPYLYGAASAEPPGYSTRQPEKRGPDGGKTIWGQPDSKPGRFLWWDLLPVLPYFILMVVLPLGIWLLVGPAETPDDASGPILADPQAAFLENALYFVVLTALCLAVSAKALWRSLRVFTHTGLAWLKILLIPALYVGALLTNMILGMLAMGVTGVEPEVSANQMGIQEMTGVIPFWAALVVFGLLGPYVEEYFFRHLLIGKLSRHINIWVCAVISMAIFALMHVWEELVSGEFTLLIITLAPYLGLSVIFTLTYIFTGRSLMFVWLLHAFNNSMALVMTYFVLPHVEDIMPVGFGIF